MTQRTYQVLFWSMLSMTVFVFAWYAYLYSRGLVTFSLGPRLDLNATESTNTTQE